jgi:hypothetical protein
MNDSFGLFLLKICTTLFVTFGNWNRNRLLNRTTPFMSSKIIGVVRTQNLGTRATTTLFLITRNTTHFKASAAYDTVSSPNKRGSEASGISQISRNMLKHKKYNFLCICNLIKTVQAILLDIFRESEKNGNL